MGVLPFMVRRLLAGILVLILVSVGTFWLGRYAPGDPITLRTGGHASSEAVARIKRQLHLDDPLILQYLRYMGGVLHGDLGTSQRHPNVYVSDIIFPKMWISLQENIYPFMLIFGLGIPLGIYLALRRGHWQDPALTSVLLILAAIPVFLLIPALQVVFAAKLNWLPVGGWHGIFSKNIILPTIVLTIGSWAGIARLVRITTLQVMEEEFVRTARAKGLPETVVMVRHTLRNAMLPVITNIIYALFFLFTGTFFVEYLFGIPGIGNELITSINSRDYDEIMAMTMITTTAFIVANIVMDILYGIVDPRVQIGAA